MKKVAFKTLGCRLNQFETDSLVTQFHNAGYEVVEFGKKADVSIINTCTVTNSSDQKSRNYINQASGLSPDGITVVSGCMANHKKEILEKQENITYVVENEQKNDIFNLVDSHFKGELVHPGNLKADVFGFETVEKSLHTRTSIKIQDGCDNFCSFCIIPRVRGRAISRPAADIVDNVKRVIDNGFKEIVLTGVNISRYEYEGLSFKNIVEKIVEVEGDFRVRISSIEPDNFTPDFPDLFHHPKLNPHLHLCLQSGSDNILMKMRRMYSVNSFMGIVESFRKVHPDFNFTTDIIVGFPGETEEDFQQTLNIASRAKFSHIHTFRYSLRNGTRAARMENQIPGKVKTERSEKLRILSEQLEKEYFNSMLQKSQRVLIENPDKNGSAFGYGEHYIPIQIETAGLAKNEFYQVSLKEIKNNRVIGII
ncbi:MAG: tRNA (N(6)-L-threonylcarbamoyladenosine(37)-C(2))-methylthiotransferase MtaB [Bacteroidales bacterium]|nr:tRNA (N(6)-L-threonylcarbamoyladenosine(37)-C(2))-methylthiotransferase MtaB [Bacteroidales bacterium]MCF8390861.1 tRNA (N(6)-L-threonylcarbamoyladenosine(37)-C(2))-methylthiotransferase MtaB [Bacteroidales bacterium]